MEQIKKNHINFAHFFYNYHHPYYYYLSQLYQLQILFVEQFKENHWKFAAETYGFLCSVLHGVEIRLPAIWWRHVCFLGRQSLRQNWQHDLRDGDDPRVHVPDGGHQYGTDGRPVSLSVAEPARWRHGPLGTRDTAWRHTGCRGHDGGAQQLDVQSMGWCGTDWGVCVERDVTLLIGPWGMELEF